MFQKTEDGQIDLFDVPGYKTLIKYMALVGQSPLQTDRDRKIRHAVFMIGNISIFLPSVSGMFRACIIYSSRDTIVKVSGGTILM